MVTCWSWIRRHFGSLLLKYFYFPNHLTFPSYDGYALWPTTFTKCHRDQPNQLAWPTSFHGRTLPWFHRHNNPHFWQCRLQWHLSLHPPTQDLPITFHRLPMLCTLSPRIHRAQRWNTVVTPHMGLPRFPTLHSAWWQWNSQLPNSTVPICTRRPVAHIRTTRLQSSGSENTPTQLGPFIPFTTHSQRHKTTGTHQFLYSITHLTNTTFSHPATVGRIQVQIQHPTTPNLQQPPLTSQLSLRP